MTIIQMFKKKIFMPVASRCCFITQITSLTTPYGGPCDQGVICIGHAPLLSSCLTKALWVNSSVLSWS